MTPASVRNDLPASVRDLPLARPGQRIGLLGGSFDPPHAGHVALSKLALTRLGLDQVWWLVSPGNPLKQRAPAALRDRVAAARGLADSAAIRVCAPEAAWGTRATIDTLARLQQVAPGLRFVWLMGSDNLSSFHHWHRWQDIAQTVPIAVIARPGDRARALLSPAARALRPVRLPERAARALPATPAPAWVYLQGRLNRLSSTALRDGGGHSAPVA